MMLQHMAVEVVVVQVLQVEMLLPQHQVLVELV
jgi:hypothetical protein